jgi:hypothetical protein
LRIATLVLLQLALSACVETRFESTPGEHIEACDARWKGLWVDTSGRSVKGGGEELAFLVDDECRFLLLERPEKDGPLKPIHIPLNFVHDRGSDYVVVADDQLSGVVKLAPVHGIEPSPRKAFFVARYRISGNRLEIDTVDSKRVARMIIDDVLDGTVNANHNELHVFLRGDRMKILEILRRQKIFSDTPSVRLERKRQSLAEFERERVAKSSRKPR